MAEPAKKIEPMSDERLAEIEKALVNNGLKHFIKYMAYELLIEVKRLRRD